MELVKENYEIDDYVKLEESLNILSNKDEYKTILFSDIVGSSKLWNNDKDKMIESLESLSKIMDKESKLYNGTILKTIGDSFMISFDSLEDSIDFSISIQTKMKESPIKVGSKNLEMRIGTCSGSVYKAENKIQDVTLIDYFGQSVNVASRLESKMSPPSGFAFSVFNVKDSNSDISIEDIDLEEKLSKFKVELKTYNTVLDEPNKDIKSSGRLLTDIDRYLFGNIDKKELHVYTVLI